MASASTNESVVPTATTPFDWLAKGLFFGGSTKGKPQDSADPPDTGSLAAIDSCSNVKTLLKGIDENLKQVLAVAASNDNATTTKNSPSEDETSQFLAARLARLRSLLYDERRQTSQGGSSSSSTGTASSNNAAVASATVQALTTADDSTTTTTTPPGESSSSLQHLIPILLENLANLPFESRKHVAAVFNYLLVCGLEGSDAALYTNSMLSFRDYIETNFDSILSPIVRGHQHSAAPDVGLHCGSMYQSCTRHVSLFRALICRTERAEKYIFPFMDEFASLPDFDVSSDAMESLKLVFTGRSHHPDFSEMTANFLNRDYAAIWEERFNPQLLSDKANYMTRRVALQILSSVLLTRSNYNIMIRYVASRTNLILIMHLLRDRSPHISLDAFHVFKVFVANPNKPPEVVKILRVNSVKLCRYLETLHKDKEESDAQFRDEKALIISTIEKLSS